MGEVRRATRADRRTDPIKGNQMTQLYAKIKRRSKYYSQNSYHTVDGKFVPFEVEYDPRIDRFIGGVGGNYPVDHLSLYIKQGSGFIRIGA